MCIAESPLVDSSSAGVTSSAEGAVRVVILDASIAAWDSDISMSSRSIDCVTDGGSEENK